MRDRQLIVRESRGGAISTSAFVGPQGRAAFEVLERRAPGTAVLAIARIAMMQGLHELPRRDVRGLLRVPAALMRAADARRRRDFGALDREAQILLAAGDSGAQWGHGYRAMVLEARGDVAAMERELDLLAREVIPRERHDGVDTRREVLQAQAALHLAGARSAAGQCDAAEEYWALWHPTFGCGIAAMQAGAQIERIRAECRAR